MSLNITNRGTMPRECLEVIGLSSKRGRTADSSAIGQFGSGTKFAAAAALRLGLHASIASADSRGKYLLVFEGAPFQPEGYDTHHRIVYLYHAERDGTFSPDYRYATDRVIEAFPAWDEPIGADDKHAFKAVREYVCNAYDEDKAFRVSFTEEPASAADGETVVSLADHPEFHDMFVDHPARYFKFLSDEDPVYVAPKAGEMWLKSDERSTRLFMLGVLVGCMDDPKHASLFDYSVYDKTILSEERILKSQEGFLYRVGKILASLEDPAIIHLILRAILEGAGAYEASALETVHSYNLTDGAKKAWLEGVRQLFGEKIALSSGHPHVDEGARQVMGYCVPTRLPDTLTAFLVTIGIPSALDVIPQDKEGEYRRVQFGTDLSVPEQAKFFRAYRMFSACFPEYAKFPVVFYVPLSERMRRTVGFAGDKAHMFEQIWIAVTEEGSLGPEHELFKTLAHEGRHCLTKADDYDIAFVSRADNDLAVMAYRAKGRARFPGTNVLVPRTGNPAMPTFAPLPDDEEPVEYDITDELDALAVSDEHKS